jgi:hypothetical protein
MVAEIFASISYGYLKEKYGVIFGSRAQAQNGNDALKKYLRRCALFLITRPPAFRLDLRGFAPEHYSF